MSKNGVQINVRAPREVAEALREESRRRRLPLGETLAAVLTTSRATRTRGAWVDLDERTARALRAVAAATGTSDGDLLQELVSTHLADRLTALASELRDQLQPSVESRIAALPPAVRPSDGLSLGSGSASGLEAEDSAGFEPIPPEEPERDDETGVFTVFD